MAIAGVRSPHHRDLSGGGGGRPAVKKNFDAHGLTIGLPRDREQHWRGARRRLGGVWNLLLSSGNCPRPPPTSGSVRSGETNPFRRVNGAQHTPDSRASPLVRGFLPPATSNPGGGDLDAAHCSGTSTSPCLVSAGPACPLADGGSLVDGQRGWGGWIVGGGRVAGEALWLSRIWFRPVVRFALAPSSQSPSGRTVATDACFKKRFFANHQGSSLFFLASPLLSLALPLPIGQQSAFWKATPRKPAGGVTLRRPPPGSSPTSSALPPDWCTWWPGRYGV